MTRQLPLFYTRLTVRDHFAGLSLWAELRGFERAAAMHALSANRAHVAVLVEGA